jgi:chromosome segregation ATPase
VAGTHQLIGELIEKARHAEAAFRQMETQAAEAARLADTRIQDLAHQLQAAAEGAAALRTELREAQTAVQAFQDRYATLHQERDRLVEERDGATAAVRSAEAAKSAADLAAGVLQAQLDAASIARDKAEERADRLEAERQAGRTAGGRDDGA